MIDTDAFAKYLESRRRALLAEVGQIETLLEVPEERRTRNLRTQPNQERQAAR